MLRYWSSSASFALMNRQQVYRQKMVEADERDMIRNRNSVGAAMLQGNLSLNRVEKSEI
tara:strand:+ start:532 stop:708 length:177 start_codon:yes stop_codon:yes gene_type:complete